ncbi:hypothetical protein D3C73_1511360 [compost metagenome]
MLQVVIQHLYNLRAGPLLRAEHMGCPAGTAQRVGYIACHLHRYILQTGVQAGQVEAFQLVQFSAAEGQLLPGTII